MPGGPSALVRDEFQHGCGDGRRRRALLLVIFPGRDLCEDEPALWLLW